LRSFDLNATAVEFLLTDLQTALIFMDVAHTSGDPEIKQRNYVNARRAYDTVIRSLPAVEPKVAQQQTIDEKLRLLKARLEAVGERF